MQAKIGQALSVGLRPEHNAREFAFDIAKWRALWPEATAINVIVQRQGDKTAYPAISRMEGDTVIWTVTRYDTERPGVGSMWVAFTADDELLGLTPATLITVGSGPEMISGDTPASDTPPWIQQVLDAIANFTPGEDGGNGTPGKDGEDGATFYPSVSADGTITWTNNKGLENPEPVNIKGKDGKDGSDADVTAANIKGALGYTPAKDEDVKSLTEEIDELDDSLFSTGYSEDKVNVPKDLAVVIEGTMVTWFEKTQTIAAIDLVKYPVSAGQMYYITNVYMSSAALYAFEKADGTIFGAYPTAEPASKVTATDYEIVVPDEAVYLLINDVSRWQNYTYTLQTLAPSEEKTFRAKVLLPNYVPSRLYGKKLVACGDSITDGSNPDGGYFKNYAELVAEQHGMVYHKDAIGGSTMTNVDGHHPFSANRYLNHTDFDYITLWFGWNDNAYATLGTIDDTEDTTFFGAYKKVLEHYMTNYPTKKLGIVVPYGSFTDYQQAVRALSERYGVPCLDLADGKQCSLVWGDDNDAQIARRAALTYDTTHPNQAGHEFIATMYENFLLSL